MSIRRVAALVVLALGLSGCGHLMESVANVAGLPSQSKRVSTKVPPTTLVAEDGTICQVPEVRFERIEAGDVITCVWSGG
jgi:hypothetical protein